MSLQPNWTQQSVTGVQLYLQESGDTRQIAASDIAQGQIGDCYFLAALGEIALKDPGFIYNEMIKNDGNGNYSVNLFDYADGTAIDPSDSQGNNFIGDYDGYHFSGAAAAQSFKLVSAIVNQNQFSANGVNNYNTSDIINGTKEIWPAVIEQAYLSNLGVSTVDGGAPSTAMETLTGQTAYFAYTDQLSLHTLANLNKSGALLTFDTPESGSLPYNLQDDHAYMFAGLKAENHHVYVELINPWGNTQPDLIPFKQLASALPNFDVGRI
jgi:hypothetical protein